MPSRLEIPSYLINEHLKYHDEERRVKSLERIQSWEQKSAAIEIR